jgi:hypothetical protein
MHKIYRGYICSAQTFFARFEGGISWWCIVRFMDFILYTLVLITGLWLYFKLRPKRPIYREDLEPNEGDITLSEAKKILKQALKEEEYEEGVTKSDIQEIIRDEMLCFIEAVDEDREVLLGEIEELEGDLKDAEYMLKEEINEEDLLKEIQTIKDKLKSKDTSNSLLWELNQLRGIDTKRNSDLQKKNYKKVSS